MYSARVATILSRFMGHERFNANKYSYELLIIRAHTLGIYIYIHCNSAMLIGDFVLHHALFNAIATIKLYIYMYMHTHMQI